MEMNPQHGYVYVLQSIKTGYIKIGGTDYLPEKRCSEINKQVGYREFAPWTVVDFREVANWRAVEKYLHYIFRDSRVNNIAHQKELFAIKASDVFCRLEGMSARQIASRPKIDRMFHHQAMSDYLVKLFIMLRLDKRREQEGVWTFTLFPGANPGWARFFTINIHSHEVVFSTKCQNYQANYLRMDDFIQDYPETLRWLRQREGGIETGHYKTALPHSKSAFFCGDFQDCMAFLEQPGVCEATVSYWDRALAKYNYSIQAKYHNYEAVAEIFKRIHARSKGNQGKTTREKQRVV
ncbi:TPA: GIY-YIG nuclease family protein [Citrobacter freundii]